MFSVLQGMLMQNAETQKLALFRHGSCRTASAASAPVSVTLPDELCAEAGRVPTAATRGLWWSFGPSRQRDDNDLRWWLEVHSFMTAAHDEWRPLRRAGGYTLEMCPLLQSVDKLKWLVFIVYFMSGLWSFDQCSRDGQHFSDSGKTSGLAPSAFGRLICRRRPVVRGLSSGICCLLAKRWNATSTCFN